MRNFLGIALALVIGPAYSADAIQAIALQMNSSCAGNPSCEYSGSPIYIKADIINRGTTSIACAFNQLRAQGPYVTLVDNITGKKAGIPVGMPLPAEKIIFSELKPGDPWMVGVEIYNSDIRHLHQDKVDLTAELVFSIPGKDIETGKDINCTGNTSFRILENLRR